MTAPLRVSPSIIESEEFMAHLGEADTCRKYVLPKLYAALWDDDQISEQKSFTDGRIVVAGKKVIRKKQKRTDYLLRYRRDFVISVLEAKPRQRTGTTQRPHLRPERPLFSSENIDSFKLDSSCADLRKSIC